jgi:hypothetical protein
MVSDPRTVAAAFDAGINFFFLSADLHWPAYEASRRGLARLLSKRGMRDRVVIAVASYATQRAFCHAPFLDVLEALPWLRTIDVTIIGGTYESDFGSRLDEYRDHRSGTRFPATRALGATFHDRATAAHATTRGLVDIAYCRYNALRRGAERDLFPFVGRRRKTRLYNFKSVDGYLGRDAMRALGVSASHWRPSPTDYYRFILSRPEIDGLLCSPSTPREIDALATAMEAGPVTDEERRYICDLADLSSGRARLAASVRP